MNWDEFKSHVDKELMDKNINDVQIHYINLSNNSEYGKNMKIVIGDDGLIINDFFSDLKDGSLKICQAIIRAAKMLIKLLENLMETK